MLKNAIVLLQHSILNNKLILNVLKPVYIEQIKQYGRPHHFLSFNKKEYPIQGTNEERRPAYVCHQKCDIRYTPKKMLYVAWLIRGMSVDEALKQLSFVLKKGGAIVKQTILEAQELAVTNHNVEFRSNLWIAESFSTKAKVIKGLRKHAKKRFGEIRYIYSNYYVRLEEGEPPKDYYKLGCKTTDELLEEWKIQMQMRKVASSL